MGLGKRISRAWWSCVAVGLAVTGACSSSEVLTDGGADGAAGARADTGSALDGAEAGDALPWPDGAFADRTAADGAIAPDALDGAVARADANRADADGGEGDANRADADGGEGDANRADTDGGEGDANRADADGGEGDANRGDAGANCDDCGAPRLAGACASALSACVANAGCAKIRDCVFGGGDAASACTLGPSGAACVRGCVEARCTDSGSAALYLALDACAYCTTCRAPCASYCIALDDAGPPTCRDL